MNSLRNKKKQAAILFFVFLLSMAIGIFLQGFFSVKKTDDTAKMPEAEAAEDRVINFLLVGVDDREDEIGRSDTMLILSFNPAGKRAELISVPRDSRVSIPLHGETKLNHSYAYGGIQLTKQMVEKAVGLHIDNYFVFNFKGFKNAMEAIGGVDLDVDKDMHYRDDWDDDGGLVIDLKKGYQHLDAEKSIEYVRYRDGDGDIGRVARQQKFLKATSEKLFSAESMPKLPSIIRGVYQNIDTDMSFADCLKLTSMLKDGSDFEIHSMTVPGKPEMIDDLSYWIIDSKKLKEELEVANIFLTEGVMVASAEEEPKETEDEGMFRNREMIDISAAKWEKDDNQKSAAELEKIKQAELRERQEEIAYRRAVEEMESSRIPDSKISEENEKPKKRVTLVNASGSEEAAMEMKSSLEARGFAVDEIGSSSISAKSSAMIADDDVAESVSGLGVAVSRKPSGGNTIVVGKDRNS